MKKFLTPKHLVWLIPLILVLIGSSVWLMTPLSAIIGYRFEPDFPKNEGQSITLSPLKESVSVSFDHGVPHIEASNASDLAAATGFVQARDRLFQLDLLRHFAAGRLSELVGDRPILGSTTVDFDRAMRGWDFKGRTQVDLSTMEEFDRKILQAYSSGVNDAMKKYRTPEHRILGVWPKPWTISDTILVGLLQSWAMIHNWGQEAVRFSLAAQLGLETAEQLYPHSPFSKISTIANKAGKKKLPLPEAVAPELKELFPNSPIAVDEKSDKVSHTMTDLLELLPSASNAWVLSGERTDSGSPILHNDMHLTHLLPSILYLQRLKTPDLDAIGVTMPGIPFLVSGYNGKLAWGVTSAAADIIDLVIEKKDPNRDGYVLSDNGDCPLIDEKITLRVKNGNRYDLKDIVLRKTCHGPIINDMYPSFFPAQAPLVSIRWQVPEIQNIIGHLYRANKSSSVFELRDHLMKIPNPIQNVMVADKQGNFGFFSTGSVPKRKHHRGTFPIPGWSKRYEWDGWTSPSEMPHSFNDSSGLYINTNNTAVDPYVHRPIFQIDSAKSLRYEAVADRIKLQKKYSQAELQDIQSDTQVYRAREILPFILSDLQSQANWSEQEKVALKLLSRWDLKASKDSGGALIFFQLYRQSIIEALQAKVNPGVLYFFLKRRYSGNAVDTWFHKEDHIAWDDFSTAKRESRAEALTKAFKKSVKILFEKYGDDTSRWAWGRAHFHRPTHAFGGHWALDFFNLQKIPLAGANDSVWKAQFNMSDSKQPFKNTVGPVYRFSIDLSKPEQAGFSIDTGQSGWPLSPHYGDIYEKWMNNELLPMKRSSSYVASLKEKIFLVPN